MAKPPGRSPAALAVRLGHDFARCDLLAEALTHPSAASRRHHSYERLEFLGDRVLGLVVADMLIDAFPGEPEGDLALRHAALVRREALSAVAGEIGLGDHLRLAPGEAEAGIRDNAAIQADAMEAVIAALYLDGGLEAARRFIARYWARPMAEATRPPRDAKTALQEWAQGRGLPLPQYCEQARSGPPHGPTFTVEVRLAGKRPVRATGASKRAAEQAAAEKMLHCLGAAESD